MCRRGSSKSINGRVDDLQHGLTEQHHCMQVLNINSQKTEIDSFVFEDLELIGYQSHKKIAMQMAV